MNGVIGLHLIGDAGHSDENAVIYAKALGGRYATVVNSPKLAQKLMDAGVEVIGRVKTPSWDDDDADNHQSGKEWATYLNAVYPPGVILTAGNELGDGTPERTQAWMLAFVEESANLNRRVAAYNSAYLNPIDGYWATQSRALDAIRANNGLVCLHEGFTPKYRGETALGVTVGRFLPMMQRHRVNVVVTELCGSAGADFGWKRLYNNSVDAAAEDLATAAAFYAEHGVYATVFSYYPWNNGHGFEYYDSELLKRELVIINEVYPVKAPVIEESPVAKFDMMKYVCPPNGRKLRLFGLGDEHCQCTQESDGWILQRKNELSEEFQVTPSRIRRGADTSSLYTPDGQYKGFFYIQYTKQANGALTYGCDWCPRYMEHGETFVRNAHVVEITHDNQVKAEYDATTTLTFVKFYASFTDPQSGITVNNVVELHWAGDEHYFYAENYGLIRWWNVRQNYGSWLGTLANVAIRQPIPHPRPRPVVPFPPEGIPAPPVVVTPPVLGAGVMMTVNAPDGLKHRTDGDTSATALRTLLYQQPMMVYPATSKVADGWTWVFCTTATGEPGWSALTYLSAVLPPVTWTVKLPVPFVSQQGAEAARSANDCRVATLLMLERNWFLETLKRVPTVPTVDDLVKYTRLSNPTPPKGLDFADVDALAKQTGFDVDYIQPMTNEKIVGYLNKGKPVSVLVDYSRLNPNGAAIAHEVAVIGYSDNAFLLHDPYLMGANVTVTKAKLEDAMRSSPGNSVGFQGFILSDAA